MPASPKVRFTYEDYLATPEDAARRHEVIDGELFVTAAPRWRHQAVLLRLGRALLDIVIEHGLGDVATAPTVRLREDLVMEPDLVFLTSDRLHLIQSGRVLGPPDLVVEILSPTNRGFDRRLKRERYLENGVAEVWIVDADENTIEVWRPGEEPLAISSGAVEWRVGGRAFEIPLSDIFRG